MLTKIQSMGHYRKLLIAVIHDAVMSVLALLFSIALRFDGFSLSSEFHPYLLKLIILTPIIQVPLFYIMGVYKGLWRYSSTPDLIKVIKSAVFASGILYFSFYLLFRLDQIPRSLPIIQTIILISLMGGGRLIYRIVRDSREYGAYVSKGRDKLLIIGAGDGGERLFREIRKNPTLNLHVIGFVDDMRSLRNRSIHGVPILGNIEELPVIVENTQVRKAYVAIPSADGKLIRKIYEILKPYNLEIKVLPNMSKLIEGNIKVQNLERIKIEDLLGREEVSIETATLSHMLKGKKVLVTGAGGSIGSEICRQLAHFEPSSIIAIDTSEYNCYELDKALKIKFPQLSLQTIVGDVRDKSFISQLIKNEAPSVVFHAAAYKHVPLMEFNPFEACRTNILGTEIVAQSCIDAGIERFVLVSTDKAVNPTNIMGTTKRIAELVIQNLKNQNSATKLMTVRFGNVLGSSGSVIPLFREQIKRGGPITVTHPEITRYFMSIPEASKLVIQAGAIGQGGEIFVLNMGSPVKILNLAKEMISLSGLQEEVDIKIKVTGLRPGEKLYEEPLMDQEALIGTTHPKVLVSNARPVPNEFPHLLSELKGLTHQSGRNNYIKIMKKMVPEYKPFLTEHGQKSESHDERTFQ